MTRDRHQAEHRSAPDLIVFRRLQEEQMVDFDLTEEQLAIQRTAKEFAETEIKPYAE